MEARGARESFTWGPQALWLLCGLVWLFYVVVRDTPAVAKNVLVGAIATTCVGALGVAFAARRRRQRIVLYPLHGELGCYRGTVFQYSFALEEVLPVRLGRYGAARTVISVLIPLAAVFVALGVVLYVNVRGGSGKAERGDELVFAYAMLYTAFAFVAVFRSRFLLVFCWIPNGKGQTNEPVHFPVNAVRWLERADTA